MTARGALLVVTWAAACAPAGTPREAAPRTMVERAIAAAGGEASLRRATALEWDGRATIHAGGRTIRIAGTWKIQPPDTAIVSTYDVTRGPASVRSLVLAAPDGWLVNGAARSPMDSVMLRTEKIAFYLYEVMRLAPLLDAATVLSEMPADSAGNRGVLVERAGRPPVTVYFDRTGRLAHLAVNVPSADGTVRQDFWFSGTIAGGGIRWPARLDLRQNGQPYFDLTIDALRVGTRVVDSLLR